MNTHTYEELKNKLSSYDEWKKCITVDCGIPLTANYIDERIAELNNADNPNTKKFINTWGIAHL